MTRDKRKAHYKHMRGTATVYGIGHICGWKHESDNNYELACIYRAERDEWKARAEAAELLAEQRGGALRKIVQTMPDLPANLGVDPEEIMKRHGVDPETI